ncbi:MAG: hypothetical protein C4B55_03265 [Candidatus Methanophagaceae archaeon]|nr:MAG: hypothetical protein C4B55_03265 [Methanophagales archaeon]
MQRGIEIVRRFADFGFQVQPEAVEQVSELLSQQSDAEAESLFDLNKIVEGVSSSLDPSVFVISSEQVAEFLKNNGTAAAAADAVVEAPEIIKSFSDDGKGVEQKDFLPHFLDRYERLSRLIKRRLNCGQIKSLKLGQGRERGRGQGWRDEEVSVVGMVSSVNRTAKGNLRVELEDPTGRLPVILQPQEEVIPDEIIGVAGSFSSDGGFLFASRVVRPDVPLLSPSATSQSAASLKSKPLYAVFISDLHVGSKTFLEESWNSFVQWLRAEAKKMGIAYLVVAGDLVDGIGVYPGQEEDLSILDIEEQYKTVAGYFHDLPSHLHVVVSPGNHDAVRGAEPQPPLPADLQRLFPKNTSFVSSPAYVKLGGSSNGGSSNGGNSNGGNSNGGSSNGGSSSNGGQCSRLVLIYHGQSYDDFINSVSRLSYSKPEEVMQEMLRRRHVAPIYGRSVSVVPDGQDCEVIDLVPDIFHCGHTHTVGVSKYRNVLLINSGTWQSQTPYQEKRDIKPVPGCATLVELREMKARVLDFEKCS